MRFLASGMLLVCFALPLFSQGAPDASMDKKVAQSYQQGLQSLQQRNSGVAVSYFRKADKQDGGRCMPCQEQLIQIGLQTKDWKAVEDGASELATEVKEPKQQAVAHHYLGLAYENQGLDKDQTDLLSHAHDEFTKATSLYPQLLDAVFEDGKVLAHLRRDDEAKTEFQKFVAITPEGLFKRWRAQQFINKPELARANLVPEFGLFTADGQRISVRDFVGKVVLVHFWSTTCDTCRYALPRLREIAQKFQGQPFVLLSVSVDHDNAAWQAFLSKNDVPGLQYRDGFNGPLAQLLGVRVNFQSSVENAVPSVWTSSYGLKEDVPKTFTIDADGVLQDEKLSDALIGKLQELIAHAGHSQVK